MGTNAQRVERVRAESLRFTNRRGSDVLDAGWRYDVVAGRGLRDESLGDVEQVLERISWQREVVAGWRWRFIHYWSPTMKTRREAGEALRAAWIRFHDRPAHIPSGWVPFIRCPCGGWLYAEPQPSGEVDGGDVRCWDCVITGTAEEEAITWKVDGTVHRRGVHFQFNPSPAQRREP